MSQQLWHLPAVGKGVQIQSWIQPSTLGGQGGRWEEEDPRWGVNRISRCPALKRILAVWDYSPQTLIACQKTLFISSLNQFQMLFQKPQHWWQQQRQHSMLCLILILSGSVHSRSFSTPFFSPRFLLQCHMSYMSKVGSGEGERRVMREMGGQTRWSGEKVRQSSGSRSQNRELVLDSYLELDIG